MKKSMRWHRECLIAQRDSLKHYLEQISNIQAVANRLARDILLHEKQVAQAEKEGRDGFDPERYMHKRGEES